ncbi:MAG: alpha/beta fold hydrolase [Deltaproteobacteria bacterium]|nr:alpha/beta fold hydrolase [Deltaproteobacteria bacterium]
MKSDVQFYSEGALVKAHLYIPAGAGPHPVVVLAHGFAGVKEMLLPAYAEYFAQNGIAALTFDYRGFGESEGIPGRLVPHEQITDIRNAITYVASLDTIDSNRIALWGTSYGGANAIMAASKDKRVKALTVQLTFGSGERVIMGDKSDEEKAKLRDSIDRIWTKAVTSNKQMMLGVNRLLADDQSKAFYNQFVEKFDALKIKMPFLTMKETMEHCPEDYLEEVNAPILITVAGNDLVNPPSESHRLFELANDPKSLLEIEGATHYEVYSGDHFNTAAAAQLKWFKKYL